MCALLNWTRNPSRLENGNHAEKFYNLMPLNGLKLLGFLQVKA